MTDVWLDQHMSEADEPYWRGLDDGAYLVLAELGQLRVQIKEYTEPWPDHDGSNHRGDEEPAFELREWDLGGMDSEAAVSFVRDAKERMADKARGGPGVTIGLEVPHAWWALLVATVDRETLDELTAMLDWAATA